MTEEIIIDGVNVAGCKYCDVIRYTYPTEGLNIKCYADYQNEMVDNCKGKTTCYYKQLKRLEQENKELKEAYNEISNNSEILYENSRLRIANAKLNEDLSQAEISMREWKEQSIDYRSQRDEARIAYNNLILDIVSDIPFKGEIGGEREISIKDHLHQMQKALASLEEIKTYLNTLSSIDNDFPNTEPYLRIQDAINEVLQ